MSVDRLIERLWGDEPPATALGTLQSYVSRLRRGLEPNRKAGAAASVLASEAPGYVLRGGHVAEGMAIAPDPLTAAAYAVVVVSPIGFLFGVLWARTRSFGLVVLLHGFTDLVPNLASFARTWFGPG